MSPWVDHWGDVMSAAMVVKSIAVFVIGHALAQAGQDGGDLAESAANDYYDQWFEFGLGALVAGLRPRPSE